MPTYAGHGHMPMEPLEFFKVPVRMCHIEYQAEPPDTETCHRESQATVSNQVALGAHVLPNLWPNASQLSQAPSAKERQHPATRSGRQS